MRVAAEKQTLTPPELAELWGISPAKIIGFIRSGELRAINVAQSDCHRPRYLIDVADIERLEQSRRVIPDGGLSTTQKLRRKAAAGVKEFF